MERTKRGLELLQMVLCFQHMKIRLWKSREKIIQMREDREEISGRSREEREEEDKREISRKGWKRTEKTTRVKF